jgi:hypothetical protein
MKITEKFGPDRGARCLTLLAASILLIVLSCPGAAAQEAPYDPSRASVGIFADLGGVACGLVETTADDPDWIMVTSDHILRTSDCVAECAPGQEQSWYNRPFGPCYPTNRYWKFEENSGTAFAFTMAALGVGSYDGMYFRRNVKFQLYASPDESVPFGPERRGPVFVSIDYWRDVNVACEGFDPNTIFVSGGPGALANYSIKIGGDTSINDVDLKKDENKKAHHTDKFADDFALRRGAHFEAEFRLAEEYGPGCHEVYFEITHEFDGGTTTIEIPPMDTEPPADAWGAQWIKAETNADQTRNVTVHVHIPANAAVGRYTLTKALVRNKGTADPTDEHELNEVVHILFNPWDSDDAVYLASDAERAEYVLNENGQIWRGSHSSNSPKAWRYDQFNTRSLDVAMKLMDGLTAAQRANPGTVARHFSKLTNSQDDNGVLVGRWDGNYGDGTSPGVWSGSDQIIAQYQSTSTPVRYGQCWVFGGLLTTFLRSVGIPARPLSNFESAHDTDQPPNKAVDRYFDVAGRLDRARTADSIWNFHVWCDAWLGAWNAVDATPQERSDGAYQLGPAPLSAVKAGTGGAFDVDFVTAEVDADIRNWLRQADGTDALHSTDTTTVGRNITTKAVGAAVPWTSPICTRPRKSPL